MNRRTAAGVILLLTGAAGPACAQTSTLIGFTQTGPGTATLVTKQTNSDQVIPLAQESGIDNTYAATYNGLNNTYSFTYGSTGVGHPFMQRTVNATTGATISDVLLGSTSPCCFTAVAPITGDFPTITTTGLATLNSAVVTNGLAVGGLATLSGGAQTTTLNAATSITAPLLTATAANVQTLNAATSITTPLLTATAANVQTLNATTSVTTPSITATTANIQMLNAATSVTAPLLTATTGNIQTLNVGGIGVASGGSIDAGGNRIQNVGAPIAPTDAATKQYVDNSVANFNNGLNQAFKKIDQNSQGIAVAMAMSGLSLASDKSVSFGGNVGFFEGKQAAAFQGAIRVNPNVTLNAGFGFGFQDVSRVGGRMGFQVDF